MFTALLINQCVLFILSTPNCVYLKSTIWTFVHLWIPFKLWLLMGDIGGISAGFNDWPTNGSNICTFTQVIFKRETGKLQHTLKCVLPRLFSQCVSLVHIRENWMCREAWGCFVVVLTQSGAFCTKFNNVLGMHCHSTFSKETGSAWFIPSLFCLAGIVKHRKWMNIYVWYNISAVKPRLSRWVQHEQ